MLPIEIYKPEILRKTEYLERLRNLREELGTTLPIELSFPPIKTIGFAAMYKDLPIFKRYSEVDTVAGKKRYSRTIIVDPLVFYVPYHLDISNYGIYFRVEKIKDDFKKFLNFVYHAIKGNHLAFLRNEHPSRWSKLKRLPDSLDEFIVSFFIAYVAYLYFHALTHHIIEDISTYLEIIGRGKYSPIKSIEEERFAEWTAFKALESYKVPEVLYQSKKAERLLNIFSFMLPSVEPEKLVDVTFAMPVLLYVYFERDKNEVYLPSVSKDVSRKLSVIWKPFKDAHFTLEEDPVRIGKDMEIFNRIYLTKF